MEDVVLNIVRVPETGEYKVVWKQKGKVVEPRCYYTDDLEDAKATFTDTLYWAQKHGYNVRIEGDEFIPDLFRKLERG